MPPRNLLHEPVHTPGASPNGGVGAASLGARCFRISREAFDDFRRRGFGPLCRGRGALAFATDAAIDAWFAAPWKPGEREMLAELQHLHPA